MTTPPEVQPGNAGTQDAVVAFSELSVPSGGRAGLLRAVEDRLGGVDRWPGSHRHIHGEENGPRTVAFTRHQVVAR